MVTVRVLIVDDRPFVRSGLRTVICTCPDFAVVGEADSIHHAIGMGRQLAPAVVVVSSLLHEVEPGASVARFQELSPPPSVLVLAPAADEHAQRAVAAGAAGLLLEQCTPIALLSALRMVAAGYLLLAPAPAAHRRQSTADGGARRSTAGRLESLTQREFDVFELLAHGRTNLEICRTLSLSTNTVKSHVRSLLLKLGLRNRVETVIYAYEIGMLRIRHGKPGSGMTDARRQVRESASQHVSGRLRPPG